MDEAFAIGPLDAQKGGRACERLARGVRTVQAGKERRRVAVDADLERESVLEHERLRLDAKAAILAAERLVEPVPLDERQAFVDEVVVRAVLDLSRERYDARTYG